MSKKIDDSKLKEFFEKMEELEKLLTERISDLHEIKGMMQARHAYIMYRKLLWEARYLIRDNVSDVKSTK